MNFRMPPGRAATPKPGAGELEKVRGALNRAIGTRDALRARHDALVRDVGLAKGRLALKPEIEKFIQEWQADIYRQNTHSIETLLTTIARDILPGATPIALDLSTQRGLPALDISSVGAGGAREDIYEDQGGAVSNVVSLGLRLIAVVKSGGSRFLALDEPECWVKPDRIPAFFEVLGDASRRLGVQTLSITHHSDVANFGPDVRIGTISRSAPETSVITCDQPEHPWSDDEPGIRYIRLRDFQAFEDTTVSLSPGVNVIVGTNNYGKSCVIRSLRAMFYGTLRDTLIRHGKPTMSVEIGLAGGRTLSLVRQRRGSPKNLWTLREADGSTVVEDGETRQTDGNKPPAWLDDLLGIHPVEDLEIHLTFQKEPDFLIDQPASKRAAVLSIGQESGYIHDMLAVQKENNTRDAALVRQGEAELASVLASLEAMAGLDDLSARLDEAEALNEQARQWTTYLEGLRDVQRTLLDLRAQADRAKARLAAFADLPSDEALAALRKDLDTAARREAVASDLSRARAALARARDRASILSGLPEAPPKLASTDRIEAAISRIRSARHDLAVATARREALSGLPEAVPALGGAAPAADALARIRKAQDDLERARAAADATAERERAARADLDAALEATGSRCPTCGSAVDADRLLSHNHAA